MCKRGVRVRGRRSRRKEEEKEARKRAKRARSPERAREGRGGRVEGGEEKRRQEKRSNLHPTPKELDQEGGGSNPPLPPPNPPLARRSGREGGQTGFFQGIEFFPDLWGHRPASNAWLGDFDLGRVAVPARRCLGPQPQPAVF